MKNQDTVALFLIIIVVILGSFFLYKKYQDKPTSKLISGYINDINNDFEIIKKEKVRTRIKFEIPTETNQPIILFDNGKDISPNKIRSIEYFDENGFCYLIVFPKYVKRKKDTTGQPKPRTLDELAAQYEDIETNLPNGYYDSTFYFYDNDKRLVKKEIHKTTEIGINYLENIQSYRYDKMNNLIQISNDNLNTTSSTQYFNYTYDDDDRIIYEIDSCSEDIFDTNTVKKETKKYSYDANGLLSKRGNSNFFYNEKGLLIEQFNLENKIKTSYAFFTYDDQGNCVKCSAAYIFPGGAKNEFLTLSQYNEKGLIKEQSIKNTFGKTKYTLFKFEYTYYR